MSLAPKGTPWRGPRNTPRAASSVIARAAARAPSRSTSAQAWTRRSTMSMRFSSASTRSTGESTFSRIARAAAATPKVCRLTRRARCRRPAARRRRGGRSRDRPSRPPRPRWPARAPPRARRRSAGQPRPEAPPRTQPAVARDPSREHTLPRLQLHVLVRRREPVARHEPDPGFLHPRPHAVQEGEIPDRREHRALVDELLDAMKHGLALGAIQLHGLFPEQAVDVGVAAVGVGAAGDRDGFQPGGSVPRRADEEIDQVLVLL